MSTSNRSKFTRGYTLALVSAAILSTTAIFIRHLAQAYHMPALVLAFWRDGLVFLTLLLVLGLLHRPLLRVKRQHLTYLLVYGFILALFNALWTPSVALNGAAVATVLVYCSAGFTALLGWWFLNEWLSWGKILAVVLSLGGSVLVSGALEPGTWQTNVAGVLTGVLSGLCFAIYSLMGRSASQRGLNPWTTLLYTFGFATVFLFLLNLLPLELWPGTATRLSDFFWLGDSLTGWVILFLLAAGPTVSGFGLYNISLGYLPSSVANLIATTEPIFTAVIAYILLGERMNGLQLGGSLMILAGVIFLRMYEGRFVDPTQSEPPRKIEAAFSD